MAHVLALVPIFGGGGAGRGGPVRPRDCRYAAIRGVKSAGGRVVGGG